MELRKFGFYDEMPSEVARRLLAESCSEAPQPNESRILAYLKDGVQFLAIPGTVSDLLSDTEVTIGPPHVFTDGTWAWSADVVYYIQKYHIAVPTDFVQFMQHNNWRCPEVTNMHELKLKGWIEK